MWQVIDTPAFAIVVTLGPAALMVTAAVLFERENTHREKQRRAATTPPRTSSRPTHPIPVAVLLATRAQDRPDAPPDSPRRARPGAADPDTTAAPFHRPAPPPLGGRHRAATVRPAAAHRERSLPAPRSRGRRPGAVAPNPDPAATAPIPALTGVLPIWTEPSP